MVGGIGGIGQSRHANDQQHFVGQAKVHVSPRWQLPLLSIGTLGAQTVWSMDMAFAPPYLIDLGLSKSAMAAVFLAGPVSGLIVQPLIGNLADNSTSKYGRRRPFLVASTLICALSVLMLGFAREIAGWFTAPNSAAQQSLAIFIGVLSVYLVDFSVNAVTALDRALMVDVATVEEQAEANAWAARLCGLGSVLSFMIGNLDLPSIAPAILGKTQIQIISVLVTAILLTTHAIVVWIVEEQVLVAKPHMSSNSSGLLSIFKDLYFQARQLPQPILEIFKIQFFAQIGWFPVLFYSTVWVGEIYKADVRSNGGHQSDHELFEEATRVGSHAFFWHAMLALLTSIILPLLVPNPVEDTHATAVATSPLLKRWRKVRDRWPELPFWWVFSQFVFFTSMMGTWLAGLTQSVFLATWVIASVGFCFAVANWVPFSMLGILIQTQQEGQVGTHHHSANGNGYTIARGSEREADEVTMSLLGADAEHGRTRRSGSNTPNKMSRAGSANGYGGHDSQDRQRVGEEEEEEDALAEEVLSFGGSGLPRRRDEEEHGPSSASGASGTSSTSAHAGTVLGLHNISIVIPQFVVTGFSSLIFAIMEPPPSATTVVDSNGKRSAPIQPDAKNSDALGIIFRLGGVSAFIAGVLAIRLIRRYGDAFRG